jgi:hypothetical protein
MAAYFALRIMKRKIKYSKIISAFPEYKEDIDAILIAEGEDELMEE